MKTTAPMIHKQKGFTLIELLIVIAILGILSAVVIFALNPAQKLKDARNSTRLDTLQALARSIGLAGVDLFDVNTIKYGIVGNPASGGTGINAADVSDKIFVIGAQDNDPVKQIGGSTDTDCKTDATANYWIDLSGQLGTKYLSANPVDPIGANTSAKNNGNKNSKKYYIPASTGYTMKFSKFDSIGKKYESVTLTACGSQEDGYDADKALSVTVNLQ